MQVCLTSEGCESIVAENLLVQRCIAGDRQAWDEFVRRYSPGMYNLANHLLRNRQDAEDVTSQALVRVFRHLDSFRRDSRLTPWLRRIVRNLCVDMRRRGRCGLKTVSLHCPQFEEGEVACEIPDTSPRPDEIVEADEHREIVLRAVRYLPSHHRKMLEMYHAEGLPYPEIACRTGLPLGTVKSRINRARHLLRERLETV